MKNKKINLKNLSAMLLILLLAGFIAPLSTTVAGNGNGSSQGEQTAANSTASPNAGSDSNQNGTSAASDPNTSDNAKQYNKTDVTPKNQMEQVRAQEQTRFQFRNMTIVMNCTQNCNVTFTADEEVTPKVFGLTVDPNQTMTLAMNLTKSPLNGAMVNERCLNFYLGIEPNAALELQAQIRLRINQTELSQSLNREVNASRLTWMFWNQTRAQWETVQSYMDENGDLVCNTNHFSTWTVAEVDPEGDATASTNQSVVPIEYIAIGAVVAIAVIALGFVAYKKRK
ncbi:MAG: hypothetical protein NWE92_03950 [Candidatus Bathyarchaeota archaeon]|nr:hypothetical protein [Candidatus Bathyarchaeota archaeon]